MRGMTSPLLAGEAKPRIKFYSMLDPNPGSDPQPPQRSALDYQKCQKFVLRNIDLEIITSMSYLKRIANMLKMHYKIKIGKFVTTLIWLIEHGEHCGKARKSKR